MIPDAFISDWIVVQRAHLDMTKGSSTQRTLIEAIVNLDFPDYEVLATACGHVLNELHWLRKSRALTTDELATHAAASRLWTAILKTDKEFR